MASASGLQFTLTLPGVEDLAVIDFTHRERLSAPFELMVRFASRDGSLSATDILDREATLTIWQDGEALRSINGVVSEFGRGDSGHRRTFYHVSVCPALWRLGLRQNSRIFQEVSPLTALNTLCDEHGLADVAFAATREPETREYLTQYRETDLAFVQRLAAEEGLSMPSVASLIKGTNTTTTPAATRRTPPAKLSPASAWKRCARMPAPPMLRATCPNSPPACASPWPTTTSIGSMATGRSSRSSITVSSPRPWKRTASFRTMAWGGGQARKP